MSLPGSLYLPFVAAAVAVALFERRIALRNERRLLAEGGIEVAPAVFAWMVPVYGLHFAAAAWEHVALRRSPAPVFAAAMILLFAASKWLKWAAVRALGDVWTMRVIVPVRPRIAAGGPYRFLRHPNYVAVIGEILALPLLGGAWVTAAIFGTAFGLVLVARVRTEEAALLARSDYAATMGSTPRFLPGRSRR